MANNRTENMRADMFKKTNQQIWTVMSVSVENEIVNKLKEGKELIEIYDYAKGERKKIANILEHGKGFGEIRVNTVHQGEDTLYHNTEGPFHSSFNQMASLLLEQHIPFRQKTPDRTKN